MAEETTAAPKKRAAKKKSAPKKKAGVKRGMAKRKTVAEHGSKVAFIMKHAALKPLQVEAKAKEAGLDIKAGYVSSVRSKAKAGGANGARGTSARGGSKSPVTQHLDHVRALRGVILHVGIDRAKEMMDQIVKDLMVLG